MPVASVTFTVMELPGHTVGSLAYKIGDACFVGDTVFSGGGFGRWDLPSGNYSQLMNSIKKLLCLPGNTLLYPGHGEATTINKYKEDFKIRG